MNWSVCATFTTLSFVLVWLTDVTLSLEVKIHPEHIQDNKTPIVVQCQTEQAMPIADCQFRLWFVGVRAEGVLLNATDEDSVTVENTSPQATYSAHFHKDFPTGLCQVSLRDVPGNHLLVGCKLTAASSATAVKTMSIFRTNKTRLPLKENNQQSFVRAGGNVDILVKSNGSDNRLARCTSTLPNSDKLQINPASNYWNDPNTLTPANHRYRVLRGKLSNGECGFTINDAQDTDNGVFFVVAEGGQSPGVKAVTVIVKQPPSAIQLSLSAEPEGYKAGDSLTATCSVCGVRQPDELALTWTLGGLTLRNASKGYSNPVWSWPWQDANVSQSLTFTLEDGHDGMDIGCHFEGLNDTVVITFLEPVASKVVRHLVGKVTGASVSMLLLILVVAVVAVFAVRHRACFSGQQYMDLESPTPNDDDLRRSRPPRAATRDVHPTNGRRPNNEQPPVSNRGRRPPVTASATKVAPQTSSQTEVARPGRASPGQARLQKVTKEDVHKAAPRPDRTAASAAPQKVELPDVQYVNAAALSLHCTKVDDKGVEYLNVARANSSSQKNLSKTSPKAIQKEQGRTNPSVDPTQWAQTPVQSQQAPQKAMQGNPQKRPRATAAVRPMPRPAVDAQGLPLVRGKEEVEQVVYAELRLPAMRRTPPKAQEVEVEYAELDWSK